MGQKVPWGMLQGKGGRAILRILKAKGRTTFPVENRLVRGGEKGGCLPPLVTAFLTSRGYLGTENVSRFQRGD